MQVAEEEEDRCDQAEDKKPPTEEVREAIMIWLYSKIVFLLFNSKWFRSVRSHRLHASSLGMPFRHCNALDQKDLINLQVRHSVERVLKQVQ